MAPKPDLKFKNPMKYPSTVDLQQQGQHYGPATGPNRNNNNNNKNDGAKHKVVIYFSDAYNNICNKPNDAKTNNDIDHAKRLANEMQSKSQSSENLRETQSNDFMAQLKTVLEEKSKFTNKFDNCKPTVRPPLHNKFQAKPAVPAKPNVVQINQPASRKEQINEKSFSNTQLLLPSYIESIDENNVIKLKIEQNFKKASELVHLIASLPKKNKRKSSASNETSSIHELNFSHEIEHDIDDGDGMSGSSEDEDDTISEPDEGYFYDWSFVQEWRSR